MSTETSEEVQLRFEIIDVTPRMASHWLSRNVERNRNAKPRRIERYARDMAAGKWKLTGDTIKVTHDNWMVDGGQRMRAVVLAGREYPDFKSVKMAFVFGVSHDSILVTDTGAGRNFADALKIRDAVNQTQCGAIVRRVYVWEAGNPAFLRGANFEDPTLTELLERYDADPLQFQAAASRGLDFRSQRIGNATAAGTAYYVLNRIDHYRAGLFFDAVISGAHESGAEPTWTLRERLMRAHSRLDRADVLSPTEQTFFIVRAWNAHLRGEKLEKLQLPDRREITNANFPRPLSPSEV